MSDAPTPRLRSVSGETKLVIGLVSGAEFVNHTYLVLFPPILGILAGDFGVSLALLGLAMGAQGLANTVLQLPYGHLSDTRDRRLPLGLSLGLGAVGVFVTALAPSYPVLVLGQLVIGAGVAGHHPTHFPLLADAAPRNLRGRAFSMRGFAGNLGFAAPPAFITAVITIPGLTWRHAVAGIGLAGLVYAAVTLLALDRYVDPDVLQPPEALDDEVPERGTRVERLRALARSLAASPAILALAALALVSSIAGWGVTTFAVVLLTDGYGVGLALANGTLTAMFVAGAVMVLVGGDLSDRFPPGPIIVATFAAVSLLVALLGSLAIPPVAALVTAVAVGGIRSVGGPARSKLADAFAARGDLGQTFAVITVGTMIGSAIAPPVLGAVIESVTLRAAFFIVAGLTAFAAALTVVILRRYGDGWVAAVDDGSTA